MAILWAMSSPPYVWPYIFKNYHTPLLYGFRYNSIAATIYCWRALVFYEWDLWSTRSPFIIDPSYNHSSSIHVNPSCSFMFIHDGPYCPIHVHSCRPYHLIHTHPIPFVATLPSHSYLFHPIHVNPTVPFVPIPSYSCQPYCPIRTYSIPFMQTCTSLHSYSYTFTNYLYYATFVGCHNQFFCIV